MTDKVQKIREEVVRMHNLLPIMDGDNISVNYADRICTTLEMYIDSLQKEQLTRSVTKTSDQEEPVSEDLDEAAREYVTKEGYLAGMHYNSMVRSFMAGAMAGAERQRKHLWKPADGDELPEIDREVIAILDNGKVVFAHRPPEFWDGKNIVTGKVTRNYPKTYDKGGWNIPNVKYWLDCSFSKEIEL